MDILLRRNYSYALASSFDETKTKLDKILNNKWYDLSQQYYGTIEDDGTFTFKPKITFINVTKTGRAAYLKGGLVKNDSGTTINITVSPNLVFIICIYLLPLLFINILFGDNSLMGQTNSRLNNFFVVCIMELVIFSIVFISSFYLRRQFEKAMIERNYDR